MQTQTLRKALMGTCTLTIHGKSQDMRYIRKPDLVAEECSSCCRAFRMAGSMTPTVPGRLKGTFDKHSPELGNQFQTQVCSYGCADKLMLGGWRDLADYQEFRLMEAQLVSTHVSINTSVKWADELIAEWEAEPELEPRLEIPLSRGWCQLLDQ